MTLVQKPSKHKGHKPPNTGGRWARRKILYYLSFAYVVSFVLKTFLQWTHKCNTVKRDRDAYLSVPTNWTASISLQELSVVWSTVTRTLFTR